MAQSGAGREFAASDRAKRSGKTWYITLDWAQAGGAANATSLKSSLSSVSTSCRPAAFSQCWLPSSPTSRNR